VLRRDSARATDRARWDALLVSHNSEEKDQDGEPATAVDCGISGYATPIAILDPGSKNLWTLAAI
jgi:hypothetical protein